MSAPHGYYFMARGWMDNPVLTAAHEPFCRRAAWAWMIEEAAYADRRVMVKGKVITLARGQFTASVRFMAAAWGWHRARVERFLDALQTETMIETATWAGQAIITVCNHARYQASPDSEKSPTETPTETAARQRRDSSETNDKERRNEK